MEGNNNRNDLAWLAFRICCLWISLLILKAYGVIRMSWPVVLAGIVWAPAAVVAALLMAGRASKRISEWLRRRKIARTLRKAMEGMTLNSIGPIYGVKRQQGEKNRSFKRRILKAARTVDTVNVQKKPTPATGLRLDTVAQKHGLKRRHGETDEQLQNRLRDVAIKELEKKADNLFKPADNMKPHSYYANQKGGTGNGV